MAASADRCPVSARRGVLGVPRSTYYRLRSRPEPAPAPDPIEPDVLAARAESRGGARIQEGQGVPRAARRRREPQEGIADNEGERPLERIREQALQGASVPAQRGRAAERARPVLRRARAARARLRRPRLRAGRRPPAPRLPLVGPCNREAVGHSAGGRRGARLVKAAFATPGLPISGIEVSRTDRGSEPDDAEIDLMLEAFGVERSLSAKGRLHDDAVDESTSKILKAELVYREGFSDLRDP